MWQPYVAALWLPCAHGGSLAWPMAAAPNGAVCSCLLGMLGAWAGVIMTSEECGGCGDAQHEGGCGEFS